MEKIKQFANSTIQSNAGKDILIVCIVILVGLGAFELGRLSKQGASSGIKIEYQGQTTDLGASAISGLPSGIKKVIKVPGSTSSPSGQNFFASSRGTKYYPLGCSAGKTIKQENRVYFGTSAAAEEAGYSISSSCK